MKQPLISLIIPVGNINISLLQKSFNSINNQTYKNLELIVIIDTLNKRLTSFIYDYLSKTNFIYKVINNRKNIGVTKSLNRGLKFCNGDFVARFDSDDLMHKDRINRQYKYLLNKKYDFIFCNYKAFFYSKRIGIVKKIFFDEKYIQWRMIFSNLFCHPSVMFDKKILLTKKNLYNQKYNVSQDYELWTRLILRKLKLGLLNDTLYFLRVHRFSISNLKKKEQHLNSIKIGYSYLSQLKIVNRTDMKYFKYLIYILNSHNYEFNKYKSEIFKYDKKIISLYMNIYKQFKFNTGISKMSFYEDLNKIIFFLGYFKSKKLNILIYFRFNLMIKLLIIKFLRLIIY